MNIHPSMLMMKINIIIVFPFQNELISFFMNNMKVITDTHICIIRSFLNILGYVFHLLNTPAHVFPEASHLMMSMMMMVRKARV